MSEEFDPYHNWLGIESHERPLDHYRLLGLAPFEGRRDLILAAADQRMGFVRSFQAGPRVHYTQKLLNELATAKLCLLDTAAKAAYDATLHARLSPAPLATPLPAVLAAIAPPPVSPAIPPPPPPPLVKQSVSAAAAASAAQHSEPESAAPTDDDPYYTRPWFPIAVMGGLLLAAGLAWGVSRGVTWWQSASPVARTAHVVEPAEDELPSEPPPEAVPEPAPAVLLVQEGSGEVHFSAAVAQLHGGLRLETRGTESLISNWQSEDDHATWDFRLLKPGIFRVDIAYAAPESAAGRYEIEIGTEHGGSEIRSATKPGEFITDFLFLKVTTGGQHTLTLRAADLKGAEPFLLKSLTLTPRPAGRVQ